MRTLLIILWLIAGCDGARHEPFQVAGLKRAIPTDDEIVQAIVGTGGDHLTRGIATRTANEFLLKIATQARTLEGVTRELTYWRERYRELREVWSHRAFYVVAIQEELEPMYVDALALAEARVHAQFWPNEPPPEDWNINIERAKQTSVEAVSARLERLGLQLGPLFDGVFEGARPGLWSKEFWLYRDVVLIRNHLRVAATGDISRTHGAVYKVLIERGVRWTMAHPLEAPF